MQLISLQIGTAPLSCYAKPEDRNILYATVPKTTYPARFTMNLVKDGTFEEDLTREETISLFTSKWDLSDSMISLGYGMLPLTSRILSEARDNILGEARDNILGEARDNILGEARDNILGGE